MNHAQTFTPRILITGANGQMGQVLRNHPMAQHYHLITPDKQAFDITRNEDILSRLILEVHPDLIINTAAYTAVDRAETDREQTHAINVGGCQTLALICERFNIPFIHLSTDYVFDGQLQRAIHEDEPPRPINYYGETKLMGEEIITRTCKHAIILRISGVFSAYGNNFLKTMLRLAQKEPTTSTTSANKTTLTIIDDQITCPTFANDIADAIYAIVANMRDKTKTQTLTSFPAGIYHYCNQHPVSWYAFAKAIIEEAKTYDPRILQNNPEIKPIAAKNFNAAAKRPAHSVLDCSKIKKTFAILQQPWTRGVQQVLQTLYASKNE